MNRTDRETVQDFATRVGVRMTATRLPDLTRKEWDRDARHFRCTLRCGTRRMRITFSQGSAHVADPTVGDVLDCLASDAGGLDNASGYSDWAAEYGYSVDTRTSERVYKAVSRQRESLYALLGHDEYTNLLNNTERL